MNQNESCLYKIQGRAGIDLLIEVSVFIPTSKRFTNGGPGNSRRSYHTLNGFANKHFTVLREPLDFLFGFNSKIGTHLVIPVKKIGDVRALKE